MATLLQVIQSGYRKSGLVAAGVSIGNREKETGLEILRQWFLKALADDLFGQLTDVYKSSNYTAGEFERIYKQGAITVTFPATIVDVWTGQTRQPLDGVLVVVVDPVTNIPDARVYDATRGLWESILIAEDAPMSTYCPMSFRYYTALSDILSALILGENDKPISPIRARMASMGKQSLATRYSSGRGPVPGVYY